MSQKHIEAANSRKAPVHRKQAKHLRWALPLAVGFTVGAVPLGYAIYSAANAKSADETAISAFWGEFEQQFAESFQMNKLTPYQQGIVNDAQKQLATIEGGLTNNSMLFYAQLMKDPIIINLINEFRSEMSFTPDFDSLFAEDRTNGVVTPIDEETFDILVTQQGIKQYTISATESDETSPMFGLGYNANVYDLFNTVIPQYLKDISQRNQAEKSFAGTAPVQPTTLMPVAFANAHQGIANAYTYQDEDRHTISIYFDQTVDNVGTAVADSIDWHITESFGNSNLEDHGTIANFSTKRDFQLITSPWYKKYNEEGFRLKEMKQFEADMKSYLDSSLDVDALDEQYTELYSETSPFKNNISFYSKFMTSVFGNNATDVYRAYCEAVGKVQVDGSGNPVLDTNGRIVLDENVDIDITVDSSDGSMSKFPTLIEQSFGRKFDNFILATDPKTVQINDIPYFMGVTAGGQVTFEYSIEDDTPEGLEILPEIVVGDQRRSSFANRDTSFGYDYFSDSVTDIEIIEIFRRGGL